MAQGQNRLRAKDIPLRWMRNGVLVSGGLLLTKTVSLTWDQEMRKEQYVGEKRPRIDLVIRGVDGTLTLHVSNHDWAAISEDTNRRERLGLPNPTNEFILLYQYREANTQAIVISDECVVQMPDVEHNEDEYVSLTINFSARDAKLA